MEETARAWDGWVELPRQKRRATSGALLWSIIAPLLFVAVGKLVGPVSGGPPTWLGGALLAIVGSGVAVAGAVFARARSRARLELEGDALLLVRGQERRKIAKEQIQHAIVTDGPHGGGRLVLSLAAAEDIRFDLANRTQAEELLAGLRLADVQRVTRIRLHSDQQRTLNQWGGAIVGGLVALLPIAALNALFGGVGQVLGLVLLVPLMLAGADLMSRLLAEVSIGSDGLSFRGVNTNANSFIAHERIDKLEVVRRDRSKMPGAWAVDLLLKDGSREEIGFFFADDRALADALRQRVERAIAERRARVGPKVEPLLQLERHHQQLGEWLARLRKLAIAKADYRQADLGSDRLAGLLSDASLGREHRIAAAVVLAARGSESERQRIRIASDTSADPALSSALRAILEGEAESEAIAEALAADPKIG